MQDFVINESPNEDALEESGLRRLSNGRRRIPAGALRAVTKGSHDRGSWHIKCVAVCVGSERDIVGAKSHVYSVSMTDGTTT